MISADPTCEHFLLIPISGIKAWGFYLVQISLVQKGVNVQRVYRDLHCWAAASSWRVSQKRRSMSCFISWAQSRCRSVSHTNTHTATSSARSQAFIFSRSSSVNHSKQCVINEQALLTNVCKKTCVNKELKQNKQEEKREKQSFSLKIRHTCVLLWGQTHTHVRTFARPSLMGWDGNDFKGPLETPQILQ